MMESTAKRTVKEQKHSSDRTMSNPNDGLPQCYFLLYELDCETASDRRGNEIF